MEVLPNDFDVSAYFQYNPDLKGMSESELKNHYMLYGRNEAPPRIYKLPIDFDVIAYLQFNPDLKGMSELEAKTHYGTTGRINGRMYKTIKPVVVQQSPVVVQPDPEVKPPTKSNTYLIIGACVLGAFILMKK